MENENRVYQICLQAFTEIFAITSHELKNTLAIINENSGLLEDLIMMSGDTIESNRVQSAADSILKQVNRSDLIIKTMNRFSHTADKVISTTSTLQFLTDIIKLTERKAAGTELSVTVECDASSAITGELPVIESLTYYILSAAYSSQATGEKTLTVKVTDTDKFTEILFQPNNFSFDIISEKAEVIEILCNYLNTKLTKDTDCYAIRLLH